ncbi:hypothetical protein DPMN_031077 [Dreissena polymorpha]|uniref:Uncharacterized protein n=1 Tax=Dreissena polymorpha TaxID=45954 RepID=A0A9D4M3W0_DREPO|nr:hypothetical protein DPMN_031077 [Dreissena polymorpha]
METRIFFAIITLAAAILVAGCLIWMKRRHEKTRLSRRRQDSTEPTLNASRKNSDGVSVGTCSIAGPMKRYFTSDDITG